jgi:hypothetical protein
MRDLENWRGQMIAFAKANAHELAVEIIEWQDTSRLKDGKLRELARIAADVACGDALKVAENFAIRQALELAAQAVQSAQKEQNDAN